MSNHAPFHSEKQKNKIRALEQDVQFRARVFREAEANFQKARQNLAAALDEMDVPADGRTHVIMYEPSKVGFPGVYFETLERMWSRETGTFVERPRAAQAAWVAEMAKRGVKIEMPAECQETPPETREPVDPAPAG